MNLLRFSVYPKQVKEHVHVTSWTEPVAKELTRGEVAPWGAELRDVKHTLVCALRLALVRLRMLPEERRRLLSFVVVKDDTLVRGIIVVAPTEGSDRHVDLLALKHHPEAAVVRNVEDEVPPREHDPCRPERLEKRRALQLGRRKGLRLRQMTDHAGGLKL
eukprot:scaffold8192_cov267-Pinguiococcus_pyrenoidosus.AAC.5